MRASAARHVRLSSFIHLIELPASDSARSLSSRLLLLEQYLKLLLTRAMGPILRARYSNLSRQLSQYFSSSAYMTCFYFSSSFSKAFKMLWNYQSIWNLIDSTCLRMDWQCCSRSSWYFMRESFCLSLATLLYIISMGFLVRLRESLSYFTPDISYLILVSWPQCFCMALHSAQMKGFSLHLQSVQR